MRIAPRTLCLVVTLSGAALPWISGRAGDAVNAIPAVEKVERVPDGFAITYVWDVAETPKGDWRIFTHFTDENGEVKFQSSEDPSPATSAWTPGEVTQGPFTVRVAPGTSGTFRIGTGLFNGSGRADLEAAATASRSCSVGEVEISGDDVRFIPPGKDDGPLGVRPRVRSVEAVSPTQLNLNCEWEVSRTPAEDYVVLVHLTTPDGEGRINGDFVPQPPTSLWKAGNVTLETRAVQIPQGKEGVFDVRLGLYQRQGGKAHLAEVEGPADNQQRILCGRIELSEGKAQFTPED